MRTELTRGKKSAKINKVVRQSYEPKNHCTYWSVGEMHRLAKLVDGGYSMDAIATQLERTASACRVRLTIIRAAYLLNVGTPDQTAKDFRKIKDLREGI